MASAHRARTAAALPPSATCSRPCVRCAAGGGGASRRRAQRLRQPQREPGPADVQLRLGEMEARLEQQRQREPTEEELAQQLLLEEEAEEVEGTSGDLAASLEAERAKQRQQQQAQQQGLEAEVEARGEQQRLQEQATRGLLQQLQQGEAEAQPWEAEQAEQAVQAAEEAAEEEASDFVSQEMMAEVVASAVADAAADLQAAAEAAESGAAAAGSAADAGAAGSPAAVEADFIYEEGAEGLGRQRLEPPEFEEEEASRQALALVAIIQAGDRLEEAIAEHQEEIDGSMLQLLARRMEAAKELEKQPEVIEGLQLLYRRLKAEVDRKEASPSLRLLDELMSILDPGDADTMAGAASLEERRRQAAARVRSAFAGGMAGDADMLSLAAQLSGSGGERLADELVEDPVDPMQFMAEATELLNSVGQQTQQLEAYLDQQEQQLARAGQSLGPSAEAEAGPSPAVKQLLELRATLEQRQAAAAVVQDALDIAQAVMRQLQLGR